MTKTAHTENLRLAITRMSAVVVVTAHGDLDGPGSAQLRRILEDLIDGQGNLSIVVDLEGARAREGTDLSALAWAVDRSTRRGGTLVLSGPSDELYDALVRMGLSGLAARDPVPGRAAS